MESFELFVGALFFHIFFKTSYVRFVRFVQFVLFCTVYC